VGEGVGLFVSAVLKESLANKQDGGSRDRILFEKGRNRVGNIGVVERGKRTAKRQTTKKGIGATSYKIRYR